MVKRSEGQPKPVLVYILTIIFSIVFIVVGRFFATQGYPEFDNPQSTSVKAKVTEITSTQELDNGQDVYFKAVLLSSEQKGEAIEGYQRVYTNYYPVQEPVKAGDRIMVYKVEDKKAP
ncbi:MAG: hypothetical protein IJI40_00640, partial [Firmicutes bacterium]|nr:hypothetical protein [Bacillota bacterium]